MNKRDLVATVATSTGATQRDVGNVLNAIVEVLFTEEVGRDRTALAEQSTRRRRRRSPRDAKIPATMREIQSLFESVGLDSPPSSKNVRIEVSSRLVGVRELSRRTGHVIDEVVSTRQPKVVTREGRLAVLIQPIDEDRLFKTLVERSDEFVARRGEGYRELERGEIFTQEEVDSRRNSRKRGGESTQLSQ